MWQPNIKAYTKDTTIQFPVFCDIKYDGEFTYWNGQSLVNKRNVPKNTITTLPTQEIYGELYFGEGKEFYSEIHSHQGYQNKVILFDTCSYGKKPFIQRRTELEILAKQGYEIVPSYLCNKEKEMLDYFNETIRQGYEGIVIKPVDSINDKNWLKMKKITTCTLLVKGLRKDKTVPTIVVGTEDRELCSVSLNGWLNIIEMLTKEKKERGIEKWIVGENKDAYLLNSDIRLEITSNGYTPSGRLRHPRVAKIPYQDRPITKGETNG